MGFTPGLVNKMCFTLSIYALHFPHCFVASCNMGFLHLHSLSMFIIFHPYFIRFEIVRYNIKHQGIAASILLCIRCTIIKPIHPIITNLLIHVFVIFIFFIKYYRKLIERFLSILPVGDFNTT